jgi:hypothetical protein
MDTPADPSHIPANRVTDPSENENPNKRTPANKQIYCLRAYICIDLIGEASASLVALQHGTRYGALWSAPTVK